jgi:glycosyltransferase involved in cell wall biosynthesis
MPPDVTLLVPCYNAAEFLPRLIASVGKSTQRFARIVCYDDGSTDATIEVARSLGLEILVGATNGGVAHARNSLAAACTTDWLHFHDADDVIGPRFLEALGHHCNETIDVVSCDADWIDEVSLEPVVRWRYDPQALASTPAAYLLLNPLGLNNSIIRRQAWLDVGGCDAHLRMWEDADVHVRLAKNGARWHHLAEVHTTSLRRPSSFSHDYRKSWNFRLAALETYVKTFPPEYIGVLCDALETAASALLQHGDTERARHALHLIAKMGGRTPTSRSKLIRTCALLFGPLVALRLQAMIRRKG